jgi:hypothetical protein
MLGFPPIICSFNEALVGEGYDGVYGLMQFSLKARNRPVKGRYGQGPMRSGR